MPSFRSPPAVAEHDCSCGLVERVAADRRVRGPAGADAHRSAAGADRVPGEDRVGPVHDVDGVVGVAGDRVPGDHDVGVVGPGGEVVCAERAFQPIEPVARDGHPLVGGAVLVAPHGPEPVGLRVGGVEVDRLSRLTGAARSVEELVAGDRAVGAGIHLDEVVVVHPLERDPRDGHVPVVAGDDRQRVAHVCQVDHGAPFARARDGDARGPVMASDGALLLAP